MSDRFGRRPGVVAAVASIALGGAVLAGATPAIGTPVVSEQRLDASDAEAFDAFGSAVAVSGDRVVAGAPNGDADEIDFGAVYVYEADGSGGWAERKLTASDGAAGDQFGNAVAVSGDRIVVGAPSDDDRGTGSGSVYVFEADGSGEWAEHKLTASDGESNDWFGHAVAVSGDRIVVGAPFDDDGASGSGSVYVFEPDGSGGWSEQKVTASDGAADDTLGYSVAVSGDRIVAGARLDDDRGPESGSAYVFEADGSGGWAEQKLTASDGAASDTFGFAVAVSGGRIVVGSRLDDDSGDASGSAYVFEADGSGGWAEQKLTASDGAELDMFGHAVAISGDRIAVGARRHDGAGSDRGAVYVMELDGSGGWAEQKLVASDGDDSDFLGTSLALSGDRVVAGTPFRIVGGAAYVFTLEPLVTDADGDGVADSHDVCAGTELSQAAPAGLKKNRYWSTATGAFVDANGRLAPYTVADTAGCSASQVIAVAGLGNGHTRFGITLSALEAWVAAH
ncbi:FG-GAP repeat protein [Agromyces sp. NPDC058064]|uniref:FG-GAP repeat protein n=1 Tax=Agromyces sp. NPDC058064 TaxID=3346322 RepID=UPI0036D8E7A3